MRKPYIDPRDPAYHDCEEFGHDWYYVRGDGEVSLYRCRHCGEETIE